MPRREQLLALLTAGNPEVPLVQRVCEVSAALLGVSGAGMCLVGGRAQEIVVHGTTPLAEELEDLQVTLGQGPCMQAVRTGSPTLVPRLVGHRTSSWPVYAEQAAARGVRAVFSFPLESGITTLGAVDLYRDSEGPLTGAQLVDALTLTALAAQAMLAQRDRVYLDGSVSALHWISNGHPAATVEGTLTRARAVDLGITVAQALAPLRPDRANDSLGATPELTRAADRGLDDAAHRTAELRRLQPAGIPGDRAAAGESTGLVLVVDDEPGMRLVLGRALRRAGYRVLLADTTAAGISQLAAHPDLDAVVADVTVPTALGLDFAAAVIDHHPGVPILFLTDGPTASSVLDDPFVGLVARPVPIDDLLAQLAELIDRADRIATIPSVQDSPAQRAAAGSSAVIGRSGRRIARGGRLGVLPELDLPTVTWAAIAGFAGPTGNPAQSADLSATPGLSAVPGAAESTRLASLGMFAAGVANQVNNMLAVVSMRADLLADGAEGELPSPAATEDIAAIGAATTRASGLVQQLMLFRGAADPRPGPGGSRRARGRAAAPSGRRRGRRRDGGRRHGTGGRRHRRPRTHRTGRARPGPQRARGHRTAARLAPRRRHPDEPAGPGPGGPGPDRAGRLPRAVPARLRVGREARRRGGGPRGRR